MKRSPGLDHTFERPFHTVTTGDALLPNATVSSASASDSVTAATSTPAAAALPNRSRGEGKANK